MLTLNDVVFSPIGGGFIDMVDADGVVIASIAVPEGAHPASRFLAYQTHGVDLQPNGVDVLTRAAKLQVIAHDASAESAVVTGYQPSEARKQAELFARMLRATEVKAARMIAEATARISQDDRKAIISEVTDEKPVADMEASDDEAKPKQGAN